MNWALAKTMNHLAMVSSAITLVISKTIFGVKIIKSNHQVITMDFLQ